MDTEILGNTERLPLNAKINDMEHLFDLARDKSSVARSELGKSIVSILDTDVTNTEGEAIADVLIALLKQAEHEVRYELSERLSRIDNVPLRLVLQIANDEIDIATPVLEKSTVLGDIDLMYIITSQPAAYWCAIAKRKNLSEQIIDTLADKRDFDTSLNLARNEGITLSEFALMAMADIAQESDTLARPLLERDDVPEDLAAQLYNYVGEEIKRYICQSYDMHHGALQKVIGAVDDSIAEVSESKSKANRFMPDDEEMNAARHVKQQDALTPQMMITTLKRGDVAQFVAQMAVYIDMPADVALQMLSHPAGQGLAIMARASRIERQDFSTLFVSSSMIWNNGLSSVESAQIKRALTYFDKATPDIARQILGANGEP